MTIERFEPGEPLWEAGQEATRMFLLLQGSVTMSLVATASVSSTATSQQDAAVDREPGSPPSVDVTMGRAAGPETAASGEPEPPADDVPQAVDGASVTEQGAVGLNDDDPSSSDDDDDDDGPCHGKGVALFPVLEGIMHPRRFLRSHM